jgi:hypothetical protein
MRKPKAYGQCMQMMKTALPGASVHNYRRGGSNCDVLTEADRSTCQYLFHAISVASSEQLTCRVLLMPHLSPDVDKRLQLNGSSLILILRRPDQKVPFDSLNATGTGIAGTFYARSSSTV